MKSEKKEQESRAGSGAGTEAGTGTGASEITPSEALALQICADSWTRGFPLSVRPSAGPTPPSPLLSLLSPSATHIHRCIHITYPIYLSATTLPFSIPPFSLIYLFTYLYTPMSIYTIYSAHRYLLTRIHEIYYSSSLLIHVSTGPIASFVSIQAVSHRQNRCSPKSTQATGVMAGVAPSQLRKTVQA